MTVTECGFIAGIRSQHDFRGGKLVLGIGDDCAVFQNSAADNSALTLVTTDALVESVHFDLSWHPATLLGRKSISVNISDVAAMGGNPVYALLTVGSPQGSDPRFLDDFMTGFSDVMSEYGVLLIGGDTVKSPQYFFSVTVIGEVEKDQVVYRSGAGEGDLIWVSGPLGKAAAGLEICKQSVGMRGEYESMVAAHLDPTPRVKMGRFLARSGLVTAMMDVSDGVATDLSHICKESSLGAELAADKLPVTEATRSAAEQLGVNPLDWALKGGEDYELLFTSSAQSGEKVRGYVAAEMGQNVFCVGRMTAGKGVRLLHDGESQEITYGGFDHFR